MLHNLSKAEARTRRIEHQIEYDALPPATQIATQNARKILAGLDSEAFQIASQYFLYDRGGADTDCRNVSGPMFCSYCFPKNRKHESVCPRNYLQ